MTRATAVAIRWRVTLSDGLTTWAIRYTTTEDVWVGQTWCVSDGGREVHVRDLEVVS